MIIKDATFFGSVVRVDQYPNTNDPEIVLAGRSNVGKSSFINSLLSRKNIAYTSNQPGKTQTLNFYRINDSFYFVDVPGYGYAKVSKQQRIAFAEMIETYFTTRKQIRLVLILVDLRHPPTKDDKKMLEFVKHLNIPFIVIGTKKDKIPKTKRQKHIKQLKETLDLEEGTYTSYSIVKEDNKEELLDFIEQAVQ